MITISKLDEGRWQDYRDIRLEALKESPLAYGSSYEDGLKNTEADWRRLVKTVLFALEDNKPIGMLSCVSNDRAKRSHICGIYGVYVKKTFRGRGIGDKLMEAALSEIGTLGGITKIELTVNPTQKAAGRLYRKYGFKKAGRMKRAMRYEGKYYDELLMEKYL